MPKENNCYFVNFSKSPVQEAAGNSGSSGFTRESSENLASARSQKINAYSETHRPGFSAGSNQNDNQFPGVFEFYKEEVSSTVMNLHGDDDNDEQQGQNAPNTIEMDVEDQNSFITGSSGSGSLPNQEVPMIELVSQFPEEIPSTHVGNFVGQQNRIVIVLESDDERNSSKPVELNKFRALRIAENPAPTSSKYTQQNHSVSRSQFQSPSSAGYSGNEKKAENLGNNFSNEPAGSSNFVSSQQQQPNFASTIHRPLLKCLQTEMAQLGRSSLFKREQETWMNSHSQGSVQKQYRSHSSSQQRWQNHSQPSQHSRRRNHSESPQKRRQNHSGSPHKRRQNHSQSSQSWRPNHSDDSVSYATSRPSKTLSSSEKSSLSIMDESTYNCRFCFESFPSGAERRLHEHERYVGRECNEAGKYECDFCNKIFDTLLSTRLHEKICVQNPDFNSVCGNFEPQAGCSKATVSKSHCGNQTAMKNVKIGPSSDQKPPKPVRTLARPNQVATCSTNSSTSLLSQPMSAANSMSDQNSEPATSFNRNSESSCQSESIQVNASMPTVVASNKCNLKSTKKACYCTACNKKFAKCHLVKCPQCPIQFKDRSALQEHFAGHKTNNPKALLCMSCGKWFRFSVQLKQHMANQCLIGQRK